MDIVSQGKTLMLAMGASPILYLMLGLSVFSLGIILERAWFFACTSDDLERLARQLDANLEAGDVEAAIVRMKESRSAEAAIVITGLLKAPRGAEAAAEAMIGATAVQRMKLERGLAYLGTLGNNAPFIGLFGTVVGIIMAFEKLGTAGKAAAGAASAAASADVMSSIAEALVATAIGLLVAIPSVAFYNYFQRRIKATVSNTEALTRIVLSWLKSEPAPCGVRPSLAPRLAVVVAAARKGA
ncbi:MAG TPA: MotA/TolQ/ExbB proton channel family protein [Labilithrix sp.]|nr:MotA/TolQ/ExbB proton channel family protein [Labilithrix sp.]